MKHQRTASHALRFLGITIILALLIPVALVYAAHHTWINKTPPGSPPTPGARIGHALADIGGSKVLLFGGESAINDTWVYDVGLNTWTNQSPANPKPTARSRHAMAYLGDDQALLFGGRQNLTVIDNAETWVYDLSDNTWLSKTMSGPAARSSHALSYIGGDQVLLFGGAFGTSSYYSDTWLYDLGDNTWTSIATSTQPAERRLHTMAYLGGDQIVLFGGENDTGLLNDTWVYNLGDNTWTQQAPADSPSARVSEMAYIGAGQAVLFGGTDGTNLYGDTWVYDVNADTWTPMSPIDAPPARTLPGVAYAGGDHVLLFGGGNASGTLGDDWVYDLSANAWTNNHSPGGAITARSDHAMADIGENQALLFGGDLNADTWLYNASNNTWVQQTPPTAPTGRDEHAMAFIGGDQALLFGGWDPTGYRVRETWLYDLGDNTWTQRTPTHGNPTPRSGHAMAYLGGDEVLLFGGWDYSGLNTDTMAYDLSDNRWWYKLPATYPSARYDHAMAYLGDDQVLLFGGRNASGTRLSDTWVYDLSANTWTNKNPAIKPSARYGHAMAYTDGDQVLLFGGDDGSADAETWVYDLSDNTWTQKTPTISPSARSNHALAYLGNEAIVLFGGGSADTWVSSGMGPTAVALTSFTAAQDSDALTLVVWGMATIIGVAVLGIALAQRYRRR